MKRLLLKSTLLLCALVIGSVNVWATDETYSLTPNQASTGSSSTTYITTLTEFTYGGISWKMNQWNPSTLQIKTNQSSATSEFRFYNTSAFSGRIKQVVISFSDLTVSDASKLMFLGGTSEVSETTGGTAGTWDSNKKTLTWTPDEDDDFTYFAFYQNGKAASGTNKLASSDAIVVTYEAEAEAPAGTTASPTISGDTPFLTSTTVSIANAASATDAAIYYTLNGDAPTTTTSATCFAYSAPFTIDATTTVKAIAKHADDTYASSVAEMTFTKITPKTVAEAIAAIDAASGTTGVYVRGIVCVGGSDLSSGAMNYWISDDGTETKKFEIYRGKGLNGASFTSTDDVNVGDIVVVFGDIKKYNSTYEFNSGSKIISHIKKVATPTFSPTAGAVAAGTTVTISTTTDEAVIYYTTDGSTPTTSSSVYSSPITIDAAKTINAFAVKDGCSDSDVASASYTIAEPAATPTFSLAEGVYTEVKTVTISTATDGATIYYTTDGSEPTTESTEYTSAITVGKTMTIKAIAAKDGMANSTVASATYTINLPDYATLPFSWAGGASADFTALQGVTANGLGSDYAESNAPYLVKFDNTDDYILIKTNEQPGQVTIGVKMIGGANTSSITVQCSADGETFTDVESLSISGAQNDVLTLKTTKVFAADVKYVKLVFTKGSNVGVGPISIALPPAEPSEPVDNGSTITLTTTANMDGWRAFYATKGYEVDENTTIYTVSEAAGSTVTLKAEAGKIIPAGSAVVVKTTAAGHSMTLTETATDATLGSNILQASDGTSDVDGYRLGYGAEDGIAFYKYTATAPAAGIVYIPAASLTAPALTIEIGETTGVSEVRSQKDDVSGEYFNLNGQRVIQPTKGLYIVNGRKVLVP